MTKQPNEPDQDDDKLGRLLRDLPKVDAPWYFESQLHQRLQENPAPSPLIRSYVPVYMTSIAAFAAVGLISYLVWFRSPDVVVPSGIDSVMTTDTTTLIRKKPPVRVEPPIIERVPIVTQPGPSADTPVEQQIVSPSFERELGAEAAIETAMQMDSALFDTTLKAGDSTESPEIPLFREGDTTRTEQDTSGNKEQFF